MALNRTIQKIVQGFVQLAVRILLVVTLVFLVIRGLPVDPALAIAGPGADQATFELLRGQLGLNDPLHIQYIDFLWQFVQLDFGNSLSFGTAVAPMVWAATGSTLLFTLLALGQAIVIYGCVLAIYLRGRKAFRIRSVLGVLGLSAVAVPNFVMGALFLLIFGATFGLFPISGPPSDLGGRVGYMLAPSLILAFPALVSMSKAAIGRIDELVDQDWYGALRILGITPGLEGLLGYVFRYLWPLTVAYASNLLIYLFSGAVVMEVVFTLPGLGETLLSALRRGDYPVVEAAVVVTTVFLTVVQWLSNLLVRERAPVDERLSQHV